MASKSVLDLFGKVIKAPHNAQPKLCMQLVKYLHLFGNESVSPTTLVNNITLLYCTVIFTAGRTTAERSVLCVNEISTRVRVLKDTSPFCVFFHLGGDCEPFNR